jgi:hypothetical protein
MRGLAITLHSALFLGAASLVSAQTTRVAFRELLPVGQVEVTVLELGAPPRFTELATRIQQAARANMEWWTAHVRATPEGQPMAYDARMGVSEAEYKEMLSLAETLEVRRGATGTLRVAPIPNGWRLEGGTSLPELNGIEIDTVARLVRTKFGELRDFNVVGANDDQRATGRWTGPQWNLSNVDEATGNGVAASFVLGQLEANNRTLLYFDAKRARNGQITDRAFRMLEVTPTPK